MIQKSIERLQYLCLVIPPLFSAINDQAFSVKQAPTKWSKKEVLGHLIDSATNNHRRLVQSQFEEAPLITYDQNNWNKYNFYNQINSKQLISFWAVYNQQLVELIKLIPQENLKRECNTGKGTVTLEFIINDYVEHLEHHLKQIVVYI